MDYKDKTAMNHYMGKIFRAFRGEVMNLSVEDEEGICETHESRVEVGQNLFSKHSEQYRVGKKRADRYWNNPEFDKLEKSVTEHPIKCKKFNYSVDLKLNQYGYTDALIRVSSDLKKLIITNLKFKDLSQTNKEFSKDLLKSNLMKSHKISSQKIVDELYDPNKKVDIDNYKSIINIDEIEHITFGGFSSRFWVMRMHFNFQEDDVIHKMPFKSW